MASRNLKKVLYTSPTSILLLFFLLLMPNIYASSDWASYQKFSGNAGFQDPTFLGFFNLDLSHVRDQFAAGVPFQPLVFDFDNDSVVEIIGHDGNFVKVYTYADGVLSFENEVDVGGRQIRQSDSVGLSYFVTTDENITYRVLYNGSDFNITFHSDVVNLASGVICNNEVGGLDSCYFVTSTGDIGKFNYTSNVTTIQSVAAGNIFLGNSLKIAISPVISDLDNDGKDEMVVPCNNLSAQMGQICVLDILNMSFDDEFGNGGFSGNIESTGGAGSYVNGLLVANIDGAGTQEICFSYTVEKGVTQLEHSFIQCLNADASLYDEVLLIEQWATTSRTGSSGIVLADIDGEGQREICSAGHVNSASSKIEYNSTLSCFETGGGSLVLEATTGIIPDGRLIVFVPKFNFFSFQSFDTGKNVSFISSLTSADMNNDGLEDIISAQHIWLSNGTGFTFLNLTPIVNTNESIRALSIPADVDGDGFLEIVTQYENSISVLNPDITNDPPEFNTRLIGQNFISPVCLDTTLTYTALECGTEPCHYTNDGSTDQERLVSTCGTNTSFINGTFGGSRAILSCFYSQAGSFAFPVYLQDHINPTDFSEFQVKSIIVINGTSGVNCNLPVTSAILIGENVSVIVPADQITSEAELKDTIEILTGQSQFMKNLLVVMFTIIFMFGVARFTELTHPLSFAIAIFTLWMGFALLELLSWVIVMIYAIVCIGLAIALYINSGGDST